MGNFMLNIYEVTVVWEVVCWLVFHYPTKKRKAFSKLLFGVEIKQSILPLMDGSDISKKYLFLLPVVWQNSESKFNYHEKFLQNLWFFLSFIKINKHSMGGARS